MLVKTPRLIDIANSRVLETMIFVVLAGLAFCLPIFPKTATHLLEAAILLAVSDNVLSGRFKLATPLSFRLLLLFAGLAWLSLEVSPKYYESYYNFKTLIPQYLFIYWLTISYIKTSRQVYGMLGAVLLSAFFVSGYGVYQYFCGGTMITAEWVDSAYFPALKTRAFSTLGNPNILASFLVTAIALCLGGILGHDRLRVRGPLAVLALVSTICLILTFSRGAWVSLLVVVLAAGVMFSRKLLLLFAVFFGIACFWMKDLIFTRFISVFQGGDTSATLRRAIWDSTYAMIEDFPLTGVGWNAYQFVYHKYDYFINNPDNIIYHAHNMYLNIAAELGLPGLAVFLALLALHLYMAFATLKNASTPLEKACAIGFCAVLFGIIVGGCTDYTLFNMELASMFWLLNALTFSVWQQNRQDNSNSV